MLSLIAIEISKISAVFLRVAQSDLLPMIIETIERALSFTSKKELVNEFCRQLRKIKTDILEITTEYKSDVKYHNWIKEIFTMIVEDK